MHVPKEKRRKLDAKAEKCILVGYSDEPKGYKCYNPRTKQARVVVKIFGNAVKIVWTENKKVQCERGDGHNRN